MENASESFHTLMDFSHPALNRDVTAIGGRYLFTKEVRMPFDENEILYMVGCAVVDTACCGPGGCAYAWVPGRIVQWRYRVGTDGRPVSRIAPINDEDQRTALAKEIRHRESVLQINFYPI